MWQRFTERARRVIYSAQEEAGRLGDDQITPEHLLLALVREDDSVAAQVLARCGVRLGQVRSGVEAQVRRGTSAPGQNPVLTPRSKRVIDLAYDEACRLRNQYVGTEHLLLGLLRGAGGVAGRVLAACDLTLERARKEVWFFQVEAETLPGALTYGDLGVLRAEPGDGDGSVDVAADAAAYAEWAVAFRTGDAPAMRELRDRGRVLGVPRDTPAKWLKVPATWTAPAPELDGIRVRLVGGAFAGRAGWVWAQHFERTGPDDAPFPPED